MLLPLSSASHLRQCGVFNEQSVAICDFNQGVIARKCMSIEHLCSFWLPSLLQMELATS